MHALPMAHAPDVAELHRSVIRRSHQELMTLRRTVVPVLMAVAVTVALLDATPWRRTLMTLALLPLSTVLVLDRLRPHGWFPARVSVDLAVIAVGQSILLAGTGGLMSPVLMAMALLSFANAAISDGALRWTTLAYQVGAVWAVGGAEIGGALPGLVPQLFCGGEVSAQGTLLLAAADTVALSGAFFVGRAHKHVLVEIAREQVQARDELLAVHTDHASTLTRMSGEIAHELKNPLASVKGLAALVGRDLQGAAAERMSVLRREVDRMQGVLDDLLNFTRPVVPLSQRWVRLDELAAGIVALHEAHAVERGVTLRVAGPPVAAFVDGRKVHQILLNLVQNALHAVSDGGTVQLDVSASGGEAVVSVTDDGPGVPDGLGERIFEAGVTTSASGSGFGLTIARMLARQHGGELTLGPRPDGRGARAMLRLPVEARTAQAAGTAAGLAASASSAPQASGRAGMSDRAGRP